MSDPLTTDLVVRLRAVICPDESCNAALCPIVREAVAEIERLRAEVIQLTQQRDSTHDLLVQVENAR